MDPVLQRTEVLQALVVVDHYLAVEHVAAAGEAQLREVARKRLSAARLDHALLSVDEHDRPEAVVLRLVDPLIALGQLRLRAGELRLDRRLQR